MRFTGIDPGKNGAIAHIRPLLRGQTGYIEIHKCPLIEKGKTPKGNPRYITDFRAQRKMLDDAHNYNPGCSSRNIVRVVTIETVTAVSSLDGGNRKMGAASAFDFGSNYGGWKAAIHPDELYFDPSSTVWKPKVMKPLGLATRKSDDEDAVFTAVERLYPMALDLCRGPRGGRDPNKAEALLIAHYGLMMAIENGLYNREAA